MNVFRYPSRRKSSPILAGRGSAATSSSRSAGIDCQTRSERPSLSWIRPKIEAAPSQPSLSWIAPTPLAFATRDPLARRRDPLLLGHLHEPLAESPGGLLAQDARRLARLIPLDDSAVRLEVAVRGGQSGAVEPERVVVLRPERRRCRSGHRIEGGRGRPDRARRRPASPCRGSSGRVAGAPRRNATAAATDVASSSRTSWRASAQVGKCTCESVNAGRTQRPARSTRSGVGSIHSCVPTPPATIGPAIARAPAVGSEDRACG